jgi:hypothetical protein
MKYLTLFFPTVIAFAGFVNALQAANPTPPQKTATASLCNQQGGPSQQLPKITVTDPWILIYANKNPPVGPSQIIGTTLDGTGGHFDLRGSGRFQIQPGTYTVTPWGIVQGYGCISVRLCTDKKTPDFSRPA